MFFPSQLYIHPSRSETTNWSLHENTPIFRDILFFRKKSIRDRAAELIVFLQSKDFNLYQSWFLGESNRLSFHSRSIRSAMKGG